MSLITSYPSLISPALNPVVVNVISNTASTAGYYFRLDLSATTNTTQTSLGSYKKSPVYGNNNFFDISRVSQNELNVSFPPDSFTKVHGDGDDNMRFLTIKSYEMSGYQGTVYGIVFNGYVDRNSKINWTYENVLPLSGNSSFEFLTNVMDRKVYSNDYGTLSTFNGVISNNSQSFTCNNKYININTYYKNNVNLLKGSYHIHNHLWNSSSGVTVMENKRITIPSGPLNINESIPFEFYDNDFSPSGLFGGTVGFRFNTAIPSNIVTGDTIQIAQYPNYTNTSYNGLTTITWISDDRKTIETAKAWGVSTPAEGGVIYAINRHSIFSANTTAIPISATTSTGGKLTLNFASGFDAFNIPYNTTLYLNSFTSPSYNSVVLSSSALTSSSLVIPEIDYISNQSGNVIVASRFIVGDIIDSNTGKYTLKMAGSPQYITASTTSYTALTINEYGLQYSYNVDHNCGKYDDLFIAYQNTLGAMDYINLRMKRTKMKSFQKESYRKALPVNWYGVNGWFGYDSSTQYEHELQNYNGIQQDSWVLNSDFLNEDGAKQILELAGSNRVYAYINNWIPVVVRVEELEEQNKINNGLIQYQIVVDLSYNHYSQRY